MHLNSGSHESFEGGVGAEAGYVPEEGHQFGLEFEHGGEAHGESSTLPQVGLEPYDPYNALVALGPFHSLDAALFSCDRG